MTLTYGSVCSGIEAASVAWEPLGMRPAWFAEVDPFCNAVLAHHWPGVPNLGDITREDFVERLQQYDRIDLLVGGTPCQSFSSAGKRGGFNDPRGNLTLRFFDLVRQIRPTWFVWENVAGILTQDAGRSFGTVLGKVEELGYGWAYRVLDAQFFGVPQRRRRVFLVGYSGGQCPQEVLFEQEGEGWNSTTGSNKRKNASDIAETGSGESVRVFSNSGQSCWSESVGTLQARDAKDGEGQGLIVYRQHVTRDPVVAIDAHMGGGGPDDNAAQVGHLIVLEPVVVFQERGRKDGTRLEHQENLAYALTAPNGGSRSQEKNIAYSNGVQYIVRRLTPMECERLQGFPDNHTLIPWHGKLSPNSQRYRAVGNSMAVPVMRWIGQRLLQAQ